MEIWLPYLSAFTVGLLGGVHCIGMCGGIVATLTLGLEPSKRENLGPMMSFQLAYNLGRIGSYVLAGAIMGGLGMLLSQLMPIEYAQRALLLLAGVFMVFLGLYLTGWWMVLNRIEAIGGQLWKRIEPLGRHLLPIRSPGQAFFIGTLWGWVPCGLVYTMLINAISTGSAIKGSALMLAFAIGTLPTLLVIGLFAGAAARLARSKKVRVFAGTTVILFGLYTLWGAL
jgi:hypothetical protein